MANSEDVSREFMTRKHRVLGAYMAMYAWTKQLDGIILHRDDLLSFWGLKERASDQMIYWAREQMKPYFPIVHCLVAESAFRGLLISNRQLPALIDNVGTIEYFFYHLPSEPKSVRLAQRLTSASDYPTAIVGMPTELEMVKELSSMTSGLAVPSTVPNVHPWSEFVEEDC